MPGLPKNKVLGAIVRLLERTCMRIGNDEYVKQNESYGLTTLQDNHVKIAGSKMRFKFKGKSGQLRTSSLKIRGCRRSSNGAAISQAGSCSSTSTRAAKTAGSHPPTLIITSGRSRAKILLPKISGPGEAPGWAALVFEELGPAENATDAKKRIVEAIKSVSSKLGNRPATCKKYYVHPAILEAYEDGSLFDGPENVHRRPS